MKTVEDFIRFLFVCISLHYVFQIIMQAIFICCRFLKFFREHHFFFALRRSSINTLRPILLKGHERSITVVKYNYIGDLLSPPQKIIFIHVAFREWQLHWNICGTQGYHLGFRRMLIQYESPHSERRSYRMIMRLGNGGVSAKFSSSRTGERSGVG